MAIKHEGRIPWHLLRGNKDDAPEGREMPEEYKKAEIMSRVTADEARALLKRNAERHDDDLGQLESQINQGQPVLLSSGAKLYRREDGTYVVLGYTQDNKDALQEIEWARNTVKADDQKEDESVNEAPPMVSRPSRLSFDPEVHVSVHEGKLPQIGMAKSGVVKDSGARLHSKKESRRKFPKERGQSSRARNKKKF